MPFWKSIYDKWSRAFHPGPLERQNISDADGVGITQDEIDVRGAAGLMGSFRDAAPALDLTKSHTRIARLKEYQRLLKMPEIDRALSTIADEACIAGASMVDTVFDGPKSIEWLAARWIKHPEPFRVYAYDFQNQDYTIAWAHNPRFVKREKTVKIVCSDGSHITATADHRVLLRSGEWCEAGNLSVGMALMPFHRIDPNRNINKGTKNLYSRIYSFREGWMNERHFIDEWKSGGKAKVFGKSRLRRTIKLLTAGHRIPDICKAIGAEWYILNNYIRRYGFCTREIRWLAKIPDERIVEQIIPHGEIDVYDMSVDVHENFCANGLVVHNCQIGENGHVLDIKIDNAVIKKELEDLMFSRHRINIDKNARTWVKNTCAMGEVYLEAIAGDDVSNGILRVSHLPAQTMFRKETIKGRLLGFSQSDMPDASSLASGLMPNNTGTEIAFNPEQIIHIRINEDNLEFYPYGTSMLEIARGPAYLLKLMEDAMVIYRLSRAPERRVFYVDSGENPRNKENQNIERIIAGLRKKKVPAKWGAAGPESVDERFNLPSPDEDIIIPIRANSATRVETLPGASNLDQIQDILLIRQKLYVALGFPENYLGMLEPGQTRITLSAQDARFARMIERIQQAFVEGIYSLCERHLLLRGYPPEDFDDLHIEMTQPSDWRNASRVEVLSAMHNLAATIKSSGMLSDFDIYTKILNMTETEAKVAEARNEIQKYKEMKLQIIGQNPQLLGFGVPGDDADNGMEMGIEAGGPNPMLGPDMVPGSPMDMGNDQNAGNDQNIPDDQEDNLPDNDTQISQERMSSAPPLPEPSPEDIRRYDLEIIDYDTGVDAEGDDLGLI